jgi:feruloyl esterase
MRNLGNTTSRLAGYRHQWETMMKAVAEGAEEPSHLDEVKDFGSNPGALRLFVHVPQNLAPSPALVVVLHGCTQNAAGYDRGTGWSTLADEYGFIALFPEQISRNNPRTCFNWFQPGDTTRGRGETLSIRQMVEHIAKAHGVDRRRIFVTGLSAGGAMTAVMLATYPDVFAGGAILAGLPYGAARNVREALDQMSQPAALPAAEWGQRVRGASRHRGPWPRVSVWHGSADTTVVPANADAVAQQWVNVHGLAPQPTRTDTINGYPRQVWCGPDGEALVESYTVTGMAHGTPLAPGDAADQAGIAGPFLLDAGISSSHRMLEFWGLSPNPAQPHRAAPAGAGSEASPEISPETSKPLEGVILTPGSNQRSAERLSASGDGEAESPTPSRSLPGQGDPGQVIADALTAAGLMRRR